MAGKRDQASHDAAIANISRALAHSGAIRIHLGEILNGTAFKGSRRSQEFLTHVVECALAGQWERLKERSVGIDVFSRDPSYDTGGDSIVRVTASDVRKRLLQHYSEFPDRYAFRIEIPAGSYIPEFPGLEGSAHHDAPAAGVNATAEGQEPAAGPAKVVTQIVAIHSRSIALARVRNAALSSLVVCLAWVLGLVSAPLIPGVLAKPASPYEFYRELLGPIATDLAHPTEIVLGNRLTAAGGDDTGMGEAMSAVDLSQLLHNLGRSAHLTESKFLNWGAMSSVHLILPGSLYMSARAQDSMEHSNFTMLPDAITNGRPLPGERRMYNRSLHGDVLEDYGLIWMARSPSGSRHLLMAGLTSAGTAGVSAFFCDPDRMRPVYEQLRAASKNRSITPGWQVLLHIHARENVPTQTEFVSLRPGNVNR